MKIALCLFLLLSFSASACRTPDRLDSGLVEFEYLEPKGTYSVSLPARVGDSGLGRAYLIYKQSGDSSVESEQPNQLLELIQEGNKLIGHFTANSEEGYVNFIDVSWQQIPCYIFSSKKVRLLPASIVE